jgi:hypothetical protein
MLKFSDVDENASMDVKDHVMLMKMLVWIFDFDDDTDI